LPIKLRQRRERDWFYNRGEWYLFSGWN